MSRGHSAIHQSTNQHINQSTNESMRLKPTYSSREVAALTGLTARQLQIWDTTGLLIPSMRPQPTAAGGYTERRYTPIELYELSVLAELRRHGLSIHQLHRIVDTLKEHFGVRLFDATGGGRRVQLLTDGHEVYARTDSGEFFNLLRAPAQPLLAIGDGKLRELVGRTRTRRRQGQRRTGV
jgi:DNA-binding transcriptional MerR regulator